MKCDVCGEELESEYNILYKNDSLKYFMCKNVRGKKQYWKNMELITYLNLTILKKNQKKQYKKKSKTWV